MKKENWNKIMEINTKEILQEFIDYQWDEELKDYELCYAEKFEKDIYLDKMSEKELFDFILNKSEMTNHIFYNLVYLQNKINKNEFSK